MDQRTGKEDEVIRECVEVNSHETWIEHNETLTTQQGITSMLEEWIQAQLENEYEYW
ncbi:MAG: hypothetical protein NXI01_00810 [Gammaproteobacteria bacterium]|nr:hypothetical protein [Gammaproteobacteria bacterium]